MTEMRELLVTLDEHDDYDNRGPDETRIDLNIGIFVSPVVLFRNMLENANLDPSFMERFEQLVSDINAETSQ